jgi:hypothetical protein
MSPALAQTESQEENRATGSEFGPLSFTEPGQLSSPSLASRPSLKLRRLPLNPLFGGATRNSARNRLNRFHPIDDQTSFDTSQSPFLTKLSDWNSPNNKIDKDGSFDQGMFAKQMGSGRNDLSSSYDENIEHSGSMGRPSFSVHSGDWTPSKIDLFSNGGFGIRAPNGFVDKTPQNGRVEETF